MWVVWFLLRPLSLASDHILSLCPHTVGVFSSCSEQGLLSSGGAWTSHGDGFSRCRAQLYGMWASSCGSWAPEHRLSGYGAWAEVFCACGIFLDPGRIPCLLHWQVDSLPLNHHQSPLLYIFAYMFIALED